MELEIPCFRDLVKGLLMCVLAAFSHCDKVLRTKFTVRKGFSPRLAAFGPGVRQKSVLAQW